MSLTQEDIEILQELFEKNNQVVRNDIAQFKDDILTEIAKLRDDMAVVTGYKDQLEDHESRLETLETKLDLSV